MRADVLESDSEQRLASSLRRGATDIVSGAWAWRTWWYLAWHEIRRQYHRSVLGPFWLTLNMGFLIGAMGWFYSGIFHQDVQFFLPYLAVGFIAFGLISGIVNESCTLFSGSAAGIKQSMLPMSFYAYKLLAKQFIIFLHNILIYVIVLLFFELPVTAHILLAIPAVLMILIAGFFAALIIGPISARFRDIPPIVASLMQIAFFLTPVFWLPTDTIRSSSFLAINPFYRYLEIVREPLLGQAINPAHWLIAICITLVLALVSFLYFSRYRAQIAFWV